MWLRVLLCALVYCIPSPIVSQTTKREDKSLSQPCTNGDELAKCRDSFFNATSVVPSGNKEAICKIRAGFSTCLEDAVCTCQYPNEHQLLETAYKEIMRNNYEFANESCEKLNTGYTLSPGIACKQSSQNSSDHYRITQNTSEQPFIVSLKDNCSALAPCFTQRDRNFEVALFNKSLSTYCRDYDTFLKCFEMKACECNMQTDQSMLLVDDFEKQLYIDTCSLITDTRTVTPEIVCAGACSLPDPGVTCTKQFEKNIAASKGDEDFCRHLATYTECYDRLVCQCGLYQDQNIYTAVSIAKYTFDVKSDCKRFSGLVFPSLQSGFPCPNDTTIQDAYKIIKLNTSQGDFVKDEEQLCPGVYKCFTAFDVNGSIALHNKDLKAICQALYEEIKCLEETTCACGTLQTRFSGMLMSKRTGLRAVCGQGVIDVASPISCGDENICSTTSPVDSCTNILNKQVQYGDDPKAVFCENHLNYGMCIKDVACSCDLVNNGSSATTIDIYKLLNKNAATYDSLGCLSNSSKSESGLVCDDKDSLGASGKQLNLTWSLSSEKLQLVTECPSIKVCFEQDDTINEEALVNFDYKRVCRNQLNTIRCMEKGYCECGLDKDGVKAAALQEKIAVHISECSKYAAFGIKKVCSEDEVCLKARTEDVCSNHLTNATNSATKCVDYTNYLSCVFDVACMCGLVKNGTEPTAEAVYRNVTEVHYLMLSHRCSLQSVPVSLLQDGFECYDTTTALPVTMGRLQLSFAEDQAVEQWASNCPTVIKCAGQYDVKLAESLNIKNFHDVCQSTLAMIQCSQKALISCGLFSTTEAAALNHLLASKLEGCDTGNTTLIREPGSSNFGTDAIVSANNSQPQVENATGDSSTRISSASSTFVAMLLVMTSLWIMCQ